MHYGHRVVQAQQQTALSVFNREYAPVVIDLVHPGNLGPLPPSRWRLWLKATQLGLVDSHHMWIGGELAALERA